MSPLSGNLFTPHSFTAPSPAAHSTMTTPYLTYFSSPQYLLMWNPPQKQNQILTHRLHYKDRKLDYAEPCPSSACLAKNPLSLNSINILIMNQPPTKDTSPSPLETPLSKQPRPAPLATPPKVDFISPSDIAKVHLANMPDIRP